jgi:spore germination cell wall hydrolase CwlJ-like protein
MTAVVLMGKNHSIRSIRAMTQCKARRPVSEPSMHRAYGFLVLMLTMSAALAACWSISWGSGARVNRGVVSNTLPVVEPVLQSQRNVLSLSSRRFDQDEARKLNAMTSLTNATRAPAPPFHFVGSVPDRNRATDCLAIAAMAEAGNGDDGQRAVIQVVLNRVRHPTFAKTICGVVFEGSHRASGCQFTFTCDGALARRYSAASWNRARDRATQALDGLVYAPVGLATHYHTDWVHPYWSDSMTKLARVDTQLFFRWPGDRRSNLLSIPYRGSEPVIAQLAYLPAHHTAAGTLAAQALASQSTKGPASLDVIVRNEDGGAFVLLTSSSSAITARDMGRSICMERPSCKVFGWFDRKAIPSGYPVSLGAKNQLGFSYFRDVHNEEIVLYDCARFANVRTDQCIPFNARIRGKLGPIPPLLPVAR